MKQIIYTNIIIIFTLSCFQSGCKKQDDFLNVKPNESLAIPLTLNDCELMLHNEEIFNRYDPALGEISSDEYYLLSNDWLSLPTMQERNGYIWAKDIYAAGTSVNVNDWSVPYQQVYYANTVLEVLNNIKTDDKVYKDRLKGAALFYRSIAFYNLLQVFAEPYDPTAAESQPGIVIRLSSDLNVKRPRSNEKQCYAQIIADMQAAQPLLPAKSSYNTSPNKAAGYALMARLYLAISDYPMAYKYSDSCLSLNSALTNYNTLPAAAFALTGDNSLYPLPEDIYHSVMVVYNAVSLTRCVVDSNLYSLYENNDLRKKAFYTVYKSRVRFKGSYEFKNFGSLYSGLATDEMYLIRAESSARAGSYQSAMDDLNTLLTTRYVTNTYVSRTAVDADDALAQILVERRKELAFRGLRWTDLRRLNKENKFAVTLSRSVNGNSYSLAPNDPRYVMPIPQNEIAFSGIQQNNR